MPEYTAFNSIKQRCYNPKNPGFKWWGGRGIKVCDRWLGKDGFKNFLKDMGFRPSKDHSIDRINNDGNYEPVNCRWATVEEQNINKRNTIHELKDLRGRERRLLGWHIYAKKKGLILTKEQKIEKRRKKLEDSIKEIILEIDSVENEEEGFSRDKRLSLLYRKLRRRGIYWDNINKEWGPKKNDNI
jgi:hypothetical protein